MSRALDLSGLEGHGAGQPLICPAPQLEDFEDRRVPLTFNPPEGSFPVERPRHRPSNTYLGVYATFRLPLIATGGQAAVKRAVEYRHGAVVPPPDAALATAFDWLFPAALTPSEAFCDVPPEGVGFLGDRPASTRVEFLEALWTLPRFPGGAAAFMKQEINGYSLGPAPKFRAIVPVHAVVQTYVGPALRPITVAALEHFSPAWGSRAARLSDYFRRPLVCPNVAVVHGLRPPEERLLLRRAAWQGRGVMGFCLGDDGIFHGPGWTFVTDLDRQDCDMPFAVNVECWEYLWGCTWPRGVAGLVKEAIRERYLESVTRRRLRVGGAGGLRYSKVPGGGSRAAYCRDALRLGLDAGGGGVLSGGPDTLGVNLLEMLCIGRWAVHCCQGDHSADRFAKEFRAAVKLFGHTADIELFWDEGFAPFVHTRLAPVCPYLLDGEYCEEAYLPSLPRLMMRSVVPGGLPLKQARRNWASLAMMWEDASGLPFSRAMRALCQRSACGAEPAVREDSLGRRLSQAGMRADRRTYEFWARLLGVTMADMKDFEGLLWATPGLPLLTDHVVAVAMASVAY